MRHILCFGDSNTWGYIPGSLGDRLPYPQRLAGVIQRELGDAFHVIEEGLNGRTTAFEDPLNDDRCGKKHLPMLLQSHGPIDLISMMLGTNDLKHHLNLSAEDVALGMAALIDIIETSSAGLNGAAPKILLVCPAPLSSEKPFAPKFDGAIEKSKKLARLYATIARQRQIAFFDAGTVATCPVPDGIHLGAESTSALGIALAQHIRTLLP